MMLVRTPRARLWGYYGYPRIYAGRTWHQRSMQSPEPWSPRFTVTSDEEKITVKAELPEVQPEAIDVTVNDGIVTVKAELQRERKIERQGYQWREYSRTSFSRSVPLPENADWQATEASFDEGTLAVAVPLKPVEKKQPQKIEIRRVGGPHEVAAKSEPESPEAEAQKTAKEGRSEETV